MGSGTANDPYRPQLADDYPVVSCVDVTGQPVPSIVPTPNLSAVEAQLQESDFANLQTNSTYQVLWSEQQ
jgi:hypothetical protein